MTERNPLAGPKPKTEKTVTYVGPDGNELEVIADIGKAALAVLKRQGFRKQQDIFDEEDEAALEKAEKAEEAQAAKKAPAKKAPPRSQG